MEVVEHRVLHVHRLEQPRLPERWALRLAVCSRLLLAWLAALHSAVRLRQAAHLRLAARDSALDFGAVPRQPEACSGPKRAVRPLWLNLRTQPRRAHPPQAEGRRTGRRQSESTAVDAWTRTSSC